MTEQDAIIDGKVVEIRYVLRGDSGETLDETKDEPLHYLHGHGNIVPGLEKALAGKKVGEKVQAKVPPEEGYGLPRRMKAIELRRSAFPDDAVLEKGMSFTMQNADGRPVPVWIKKIMGKTVVVDGNHPMAGKTLHFDVEVVSMREATEEEMAHGHVHGPGGHHH